MRLWRLCRGGPYRWRLCLAAIPIVLAIFAATVLAQRASSLVPEEAYQRVRDQGHAVVLVDLEDTTLPGDNREICCAKFARSQQTLVDALANTSCSVRYRFRYSPTVLVEVKDSVTLDTLEGAGGVRGVRFDAEGGNSLEESRVMVGANTVYDDYGVTGENRVVAVLDTGIDSDHPDFEGAILHQWRFLNQGSLQGEGAEDNSECGHGINVAGIIASRGVTSPRGIAPGADLIIVKVLNDQGRGWVADWASGVEHVVQLHENGDFQVDAIHMSLGTDALHMGLCETAYPAFSAACQAAHDLGIAVIASAGNQSSWTRLESPACFASVYSVGSVRDLLPDTLSSFTNRNEYMDFLAPGEWITGSGPDGGMKEWRGTSQAAPHITGTFALMREVEPMFSLATIRDWIAENGVPVSDVLSGETYPRLDIEAAIVPLVEEADCDSSGKNDVIELLLGSSGVDCNDNGIPDDCDIAANPFLDCDENMVIDFCEGEFTPCLPRFLRGDVNGDIVSDTTDALLLLGFLFLGQPSFMPCEKAADVDDNAVIDLTDPIVLLQFVILGADPPPGPYPGCGFEPTADPLTCVSRCTEP